ncbi:MAG: quinol:electron acceptor oxidoreductase subunit ActD [Candidatus Deferrimicrobium sp.]
MTGIVVVGLFDAVDPAAAAARALRALPLPEGDVTTLSPMPLPDGAVCTDPRGIGFPRITLVGWFVGALMGLALALATYLLYPLFTGGKEIISVPPTLIVTYEVAMLGALAGTVIAGFREMGLCRFRTRLIHDPRIQEGKILLCVRVTGDEQTRRAMDAMKSAGGIDVRPEEGEL